MIPPADPLFPLISFRYRPRILRKALSFRLRVHLHLLGRWGRMSARSQSTHNVVRKSVLDVGSPVRGNASQQPKGQCNQIYDGKGVRVCLLERGRCDSLDVCVDARHGGDGGRAAGSERGQQTLDRCDGQPSFDESWYDNRHSVRGDFVGQDCGEDSGCTMSVKRRRHNRWIQTHSQEHHPLSGYFQRYLQPRRVLPDRR